MVQMKNNRGYTLVELLAVLALTSMIIILISSAHIFGQKQYINQSRQVEQQSEARYAFNLITRTTRSAENVSVSGTDLVADAVTFTHENGQLKKNGVVIAEKVTQFQPEVITGSAGSGIRLRIMTGANQQGQATNLETVIYLRE